MRLFTVIDAEQRSDEWRIARLGRLTGSRAGDMLATIQKGEAAGRRNLRLQLTLERIMGRSQDNEFVSPAMQVGIEREASAFDAYENMTGEFAQRTGFLAHTTLMAGCSLDGHLGDFDKLVSLKCRQPAAHLEFLRSGKIPSASLAQMRHELWITGATAHDYFSWNPDFPKALQARLVTLNVADADIDGYERAALAFLAEVDREVEAVATMSDVGAVLRKAVTNA